MKQNYFTKISFTDNIFLSARRGFLQIPRSAFFFRLPPVFCRDILLRVFYILHRPAHGNLAPACSMRSFSSAPCFLEKASSGERSIKIVRSGR